MWTTPIKQIWNIESFKFFYKRNWNCIKGGDYKIKPSIFFHLYMPWRTFEQNWKNMSKTIDKFLVFRWHLLKCIYVSWVKKIKAFCRIQRSNKKMVLNSVYIIWWVETIIICKRVQNKFFFLFYLFWKIIIFFLVIDQRV